MNTQEITVAIKEEGYRLGFDMVGISRAEFLEKEARSLEEWLNQQKHGQMSWMENHFDKRLDPRLLVPGAKSVISVIHNYLPQEHWQPPQNAPKISTYAWGEDYHKVLKKKLYELFRFIGEKIGTEVPGRVFVDSAPVLEKAWAKRSGLGWIGKNTNLITPRKGSWFFIGEIILDLDLIYDGAVKDYCGTCTRCIDACPTEALEPYKIDATRCISYLTIELRENIEDSFSGQMEGWAYGCDICQEVCPWNRFATPHPGNEFKPLSFILDFGPRDWEELDEKTFKKLTRFSAMSRIKWQKMKDNLAKAGKRKPPLT
ncbi:MAG: tRNA epoxyqueuosine(34) reductase QueG [Bacteroidia bacterium]|nr:tRNA epoxyqueuosine(34) reductase QueG [Bacteroidia bacterium]